MTRGNLRGELILHVLLHANHETLQSCLRVSKATFDISASLLYREATIDYSCEDTNILFRCHQRPPSRSGCSDTPSVYPEHRLTFVRTLNVYDHPDNACRTSLVRRLASSLSNIDTLRVYGACCGEDRLHERSHRLPFPQPIFSTPPDAHAQNGMVERVHLTILDDVHTLLLQSGLPGLYCAETGAYLSYIRRVYSGRQQTCFPSSYTRTNCSLGTVYQPLFPVFSCAW
jgi:hypothetical protein